MTTRIELRAISHFSKDIDYFRAILHQQTASSLSSATIATMHGIDPNTGQFSVFTANEGTITAKNIGSNSSVAQGTSIPSLISRYADSRPVT